LLNGVQPSMAVLTRMSQRLLGRSANAAIFRDHGGVKEDILKSQLRVFEYNYVHRRDRCNRPRILVQYWGNI